MEKTQRPSRKIYIFLKTEYRARKVAMIPGLLGEKKLMIKTEIVDGDVVWIIGRDWMEECGKNGKKSSMQSGCPWIYEARTKSEEK